MESDKSNGWWEAPGGTEWRCPECLALSPIEQWDEAEAYCEDCGEHDGRRCPKCNVVIDHVWGAERIAKATAAPAILTQ